MSKATLHAHLLELAEQKILAITELIADAQASSNNDTKSSMGDKYETTREMMQIEINKLQGQLREAQQMLLALKVIDPAKPCHKAEPGAWVETDTLTFYMATGMGKVTIDGQSIMVISPASPIGKLLQGKTTGEQVSVNAAKYQIKKIN